VDRRRVGDDRAELAVVVVHEEHGDVVRPVRHVDDERRLVSGEFLLIQSTDLDEEMSFVRGVRASVGIDEREIPNRDRDVDVVARARARRREEDGDRGLPTRRSVRDDDGDRSADVRRECRSVAVPELEQMPMVIGAGQVFSNVLTSASVKIRLYLLALFRFGGLLAFVLNV